MIRGGSWNNAARNVRSAYRNGNAPAIRNNNLGFRPAPAHAFNWLWVPEQVRPLAAAGVLVAASEMARRLAGPLGGGRDVAAGGLFRAALQWWDVAGGEVEVAVAPPGGVSGVAACVGG